MPRRLTLIVLSAAILFAACSSSGGTDATSAEGKKYVAAMLASKDSGSIRKQLNTTQARCLAEGLVNAVGLDTLKQAGVTPSDFAGSKADTKLKGHVSGSKAEKVADLVLGNKCFDFIDLITKGDTSALSKLGKGTQRCFYGAVLKLPAVRANLVDSFTGGTTSSLGDVLANDRDAVQKIMTNCGITASQLNG